MQQCCPHRPRGRGFSWPHWTQAACGALGAGGGTREGGPQASSGVAVVLTGAGASGPRSSGSGSAQLPAGARCSPCCGQRGCQDAHAPSIASRSASRCHDPQGPFGSHRPSAPVTQRDPGSAGDLVGSPVCITALLNASERHLQSTQDSACTPLSLHPGLPHLCPHHLLQDAALCASRHGPRPVPTWVWGPANHPPLSWGLCIQNWGSGLPSSSQRPLKMATCWEVTAGSSTAVPRGCGLGSAAQLRTGERQVASHKWRSLCEARPGGAGTGAFTRRSHPIQPPRPGQSGSA